MPEILATRVASLAAVLALAVCLAGPAAARVGVISVTDGGSSVQQGSDLQIGQRITTGADGRVHLMFVDGSAVTVGPNSVVTIENYAYDAGSKKGALALQVEQGTVRFVGGAISKTADAQIRTPSSTIGIRGGIAAVTVGSGGSTTANFLHGSAMRVSGQGITQTATRSGSQINVPAGGQPGLPTVLAAGQLTAIQLLDRSPSGAMQGSSAGDSALAKSDLGTQNFSGRPPAVPPTIAQAPTQVVQASQQQFSQQQLVGLQMTKLPTLPTAVTAPTPVAAAKSIVPVVPAAKPAPVGGTSVAGGTLTMSSGATLYTFSSGAGGLIKSGAGTITLTGQFSGSTTITGTK